MAATSWPRSARSAWTALRPGRTPRPPARRLWLEVLEDRRVPSVTAVDDHFTTTPGTPTNLNVLANDSNPTGPGLQVLSSTAVSPSGPTLMQNADGTFTFSSAATGTFSFRYTATGQAQ